MTKPKIWQASFPRKTGFTLIELLIVVAIVGGAVWAVIGWQSKKAKAKQEAAPLVVKGFYVGMSTNELHAVAKANFPQWEFGHALDQPDWFMMTKTPSDGARMFTDDIHVNFRYDNSGNVTAMATTALGTDALFDAASMGAKEFVQTFIESYDIPEMKGDGQHWVWNGKGVKVRISTSKAFAIEKFSPDATKANFN